MEYKRLFYNEELNPLNILSSGLTNYFSSLTNEKTQFQLDDVFHKVKMLDIGAPLSDHETTLTNWLVIKDFRDQREAIINKDLHDFSVPLIDILKTAAFPNVEVQEDGIKQHLQKNDFIFFYPNSKEANEFSQRIIQRHDINFP